MRRFAPLALALASALAASACSSRGGSSGAMSIAPSTSATPSPVTSSGPDFDPPELTVTSPAHGAFLPAGPVQVSGHVSDAGSGIALLTVQGVQLQPDPNGDFTTTVTLDQGVSPVLVSASDVAGNRTDRALSIETGAYRPAKTIVPGALAGRINQDGFRLMEKIAAAEIAKVQTSILAQLPNPLYANKLAIGGLVIADLEVTLNQLSFGTPTLAIGSDVQGLEITGTIPNVVVDVTAKDKKGIPLNVTGGFTASAIVVHATVHLGVAPGGALDVTFPKVTVDLQSFQLKLGGALSWLGPIVSPLIEQTLESEVAKLIQKEGANAVKKLIAQAYSFKFGGVTGTFDYALDTIATDNDGIAFVVGIDLDIPPDPSFPVAPGSLDVPGGVPARLSTAPTAVFSISENAFNRALFSAWRSGLLASDIQPSVVAAKFGVPLPFGSTGQDMVGFFPELAPVVPPQDLQRPVIYRIRSLLPPTASFVPGAPDPLRLRFGEYDVTFTIDEGNGKFLDLFTLSMQAEIQLGVVVSNGSLSPLMVSLPTPRVESDLIASPLVPLGAAHVESFMNSIIPNLMGGIVSQIPPLPMPALPGNARIQAATFRVDGTNATYLTIEALIR